MSDYFTDDENLRELVTHMPEEDAHRFNKYGHLRIEGAFVDRVFVVYSPTGLTSANKHKAPEVLNIIKVIDFSVDARTGCQIVLKDEQTQQELVIGHVPRRVYAYHIYMSMPTNMTVPWDGRLLDDGRVWRSLSFAVLIKTRNRSDYYSKGNHYIETPNRLKQLFPEVMGEFTF
jgi:hypothetical protein